MLENELVVKSNRLVEASYKLTLAEQHLVLFAIVQAREEQRGLSALTPVSIEARAFAEQFGHNAEIAYSQLKEAATTLWNRYVTIHDIHPKSGKPRVVKTRWISDVAYTQGAGIVEFTFAPKVVPFITRLEQQFTSYRLECISKMSSIYAVRIYELLVQYKAIGERRFDLAELKETLGVPNEYSNISDFKKRVLDIATSQINEYSDLKVTYSQRKAGRVVRDIIFSIKPKPANLTKRKKPVQLGLTGIEPARRSKDPAVLAEREKAVAAARNLRR
jgi:plasmid replication initiation protein